MPGIPTLYRGVLFRSRLEATWAAYWDASTILDWEYEPFDLAGYIPDFVIGRKGDPTGKHTLVEVKPILDPDEFWQHTRRIDASGWDGHVQLVGASMPLCPPWAYSGLERRRGIWGLNWFEPDPNRISSDEELLEAVREMWAEAKNIVQWHARGGA